MTLPGEPNPPGGPRIGVALGSGAARGLAHIAYIEAMDELGLVPCVIAGTSIGALIGAGWAHGMRGADLREHALSALGSVQMIAGRLWSSRPSRGLAETILSTSVQVDPLHVTRAFLPAPFPQTFAELKIPLSVVATDFDSWEPVVFDAGPLQPAIAGSLAIPSLFRPLRRDGRLLIDGGVTNPLPLDRADREVDLLVGIDVNGSPGPRLREGEPNMIDVGLVATQIMTQGLVRAMMARHPPDLYARPALPGFTGLEFWRVREILDLASAEKDQFKRLLSDRLEAQAR